MLNKTILMGRLTHDPELKKTPNDVSVATFTLAVERDYGKKDEKRETDFLDIVAWRHTADFVSKYFTKGQLVAIEGRIQTRTYEDKEQKKRKVWEIIADSVHFAESKKNGGDTSADSAPPDFNPFAGAAENDDELPF